jgi:ABC-type multidrug transport system permease subunit
LGEAIWRCREAVRTGRLLYRADNPARVQLTTAAPRAILQSIFFTLAGRVIAGPAGAAYAFTGCVAYAATARTIVFTCDIPMTDKWADSYYRLQAGTVAPWVVYLCRALPYAASGIASSMVVLAVCGPLLGLGRQAVSLLPLLPLFVLTACTSTAFGLAVAGLAVAGLARSGQADVLFGNLAAYLVLACAGVVVPATGRGRWLADIGYVLPLEHGLAAVHAHLGHRPWLGQALLEGLIGLCWIAVAVAVLWSQDRRLRR